MIGTIYRMKPWLRCSLRVGTLAIPVGLVSSKSDSKSTIKTLHADCNTPIGLRAWCEFHQQVVGPEDTIKAFEVAPGQLVPLSQAELDALAPADTREIWITSVVDKTQAGPVEASYWLAPSEAPVGRRPYVLLARVLAKTECVAICRAIVKGGEWVCAIRADGNVLVLDRLIIAEERVQPDPIVDQLKTVEISEQELHLGTELVMGLFRKSGPRTGELSSPHRQRVSELLDRKVAGENIVTPAKPEATAEPMQLPVGNLEDILRASIRDIRRRPATKRKPQAKRKTRATA